MTGLRQRANYPRINRSVRIAIRKTRGTPKGDRCRVVFVWSSRANRSALIPFWKKSAGSILIFGRFVASVLKQSGALRQIMPNEETKDQHARVARELGIDPKAMQNHPYDLELRKNGSLLVRWHDQAPDGVIREGKLGSYTTPIRPANYSSPQAFVAQIVRHSQSG